MSYFFSILYPLIIFSFATAITPGPNNIMLLASGANYGFVRTLPHIIGVNVGFSGLILISGLGLGAIFTEFPILQVVLKFAGGGYLLYLAWRVLNASNPKTSGKAKPMRFYEAVLFQLINPKAWVLAITIIAAFTTSENSMMWQLVAIFCIILPLSFVVSSTWTLFGVAIAQFLQNERNLKIFNTTMASALALSIYWVVN